jgi:hypothetical protein
MNSKKTSTVQFEVLLITNELAVNCAINLFLVPVSKSVNVSNNMCLEIFDWNVFMHLIVNYLNYI